MTRACLAVLAVALVPAGLEAAVLTVGPDGTHATLQEGLDAAAFAPGISDVRVQKGTYHDHVDLVWCCTGTVRVSGGWDATFSRRTPDPEVTVLDGGHTRRTLRLRVVSGELAVSFLTVRAGYLKANPDMHATGAGLDAIVTGAGQLDLSWLHIESNTIHGEGPGLVYASGAGARVLLTTSARASILKTRFRDNQVTEGKAGVVDAKGGGLYLVARDKARAEVRHSVFEDNELAGSDSLAGGGLYVFTTTVERGAVVIDNAFEANALTPRDAAARLSGTGARLNSSGRIADVVILEARRNRFVGNHGGAQLAASAYRGGQVLVSDSLAVFGGGDGVQAWGDAPFAAVRLTNFTVLGNAEAGVRAWAGGSVYNTIAFANGEDLALDGAAEGSNLAGVDPVFADGTLYRLAPESPARDTGDDAPPGGLGPMDLDRGGRLAGDHVDIGADEFKEWPLAP